MDYFTQLTILSVLLYLIAFLLASSNSDTVILHELHVLRSSKIILECSHESKQGNRWEHEGKLVYTGENLITNHLNKTTSMLPNYSLVINPVMFIHEGVYKCIRNSTSVRNYKLFVEALPHVYITVNGTKNVTNLTFNQDDVIIVVCHAVKTKPEVTLWWIVDDKEIYTSDSSCKHSVEIGFNGTFDCTATLTIEVRHTKGTVTCTSSGGNSFKGKSASVTLHIQRKRSTSKKWPIVFIMVPFFAFTGVGLYYLHTKSKFEDRGLLGVQSPTRRISQDAADFHYESCQISFLEQSKGVQETQSTSREKDNLQQVALENVTFGDTLPGDGFFITCLASASDDRQIVAKTLSENSPLSDLLIFREVIDALNSPPRHRNIVEILRTSQIKVPYYIFQEFIENGSLRDYLLKNYQKSLYSRNIPVEEETNTDGEVCNIEELLGFGLGIADGMGYLVDNQFHCPALSVDKILLDSAGVCKLYDFWPETTLKFRIDKLLSKEIPPTAWCAPETVFFRNYCEESDVWSFAIVLWEIYSLGDVPFRELSNDEIETAMRTSHLLGRPPDCPEGIFNLILSAWNTSTKYRPTFHILQSHLSSLRENVSNKGIDCDPRCEMQTACPEYSSVNKLDTLS